MIILVLIIAGDDELESGKDDVFDIDKVSVLTLLNIAVDSTTGDKSVTIPGMRDGSTMKAMVDALVLLIG